MSDQHVDLDPRRARLPAIRDIVMLVILTVWLLYAMASVYQLLSSGAKVLDSLPPFWFWGIPIAPYTALYLPGSFRPQQQPVAPEPPQPPGAPA